ncbi:MAG: transposase [Candidatus Zixiibacteriota bacterium]|nr:MAG: transposase [candidate division Zixibacteria bacterium]
MEPFNSRFREKCLNEHWFVSLPDAQEKNESWRHEYNHSQPHSALSYRSPDEFVAESKRPDMKVA